MFDKEAEKELFDNLVKNLDSREKWIELNKSPLIDYFFHINPHLISLHDTKDIKIEIEKKFSRNSWINIDAKYIVNINFGHVTYIILIDSKYNMDSFPKHLYSCSTLNDYMDYRREHTIDILID